MRFKASDLLLLGLGPIRTFGQVSSGVDGIITVYSNTAICSVPLSSLTSGFSPTIAGNSSISSPPSGNPSFSLSISQQPGSGGLSSSGLGSSGLGSSGLSGSGTGGISITPSTTGPTTPSITPDLNRFLIGFSASISTPDQRRFVRRADDSGFVKTNGDASSDCKTSATFSLDDRGILSVVGGEEGAIYSVDSNTESAPFVPSTTIRANYFYWKYEDGVLRWDNAGFLGGTAAFCLFDSGDIEAYFTIAPPSTCNRIYLTVAAVAACPGYIGDNSTYTDNSTSSSVVPTSKTGGPFTNSSVPVTSGSSNPPSLPPSITPSLPPSVTPSITQTSGNTNASSTQPSGSTTPSSSAVTDPDCQTGDWDNIFFGSGVVLSDDNPASDGNQSISTTIDGTKSACDAVAECISSAQAEDYHTIDVHFLSNSSEWICTAFSGYLNDSAYFDTPNSVASRTYGYSLPLSVNPPDGNVTDPKCSDIGNFSIFHFDSGFTLGAANSANVNSSYPPINESYPGTVDDRCEIIQQCAAFTEEIQYSTFETYFTSSDWTCVAYFGFTKDDSEFDTPNEDATEVYGYSFSRSGSPPEEDDCDFDEWTSFYNGTGFYINADNPANDDNNTAKEQTFDGSLSDCTAIQACIDFADENEYSTAEIEQRDDDVPEWYCRIFYGVLTNESYFSEAASFISRAYGYSLPGGSGSNETQECDNPPSSNFTEFYRGLGKILAAANDANDVDNAPQKTTLEDIDEDCQAIDECIDFAQSNDYNTIDVHHVVNITDDYWECIAYFGYENDTTAFSVANPSVVIAYGFSFPKTPDTKPPVVDPLCNVGEWDIFFNGRNAFLPEDNPANDDPTNFEIETTTFAATKSVCEAVESCQVAAAGFNYHTFNVFGGGSVVWSCNMYHGFNDDANTLTNGTEPEDDVPSYAYSLEKAVANEPDCGLLNGFKNYYFGTDFELKTGNVADTSPGKKSETYISTTTKCNAIKNCQTFADASDYLTFNVFFDKDDGQWTCNAFHGSTNDKTEFSVANQYITQSYGYYFPKVVVPTEPDCNENFGSWDNFYFGTGNSMNTVNAANTDSSRTPKTVTYTDSQFEECKIIDLCIKFAAGNSYKTIALVFDDIADTWTCTAFSGSTNDQTKFNQADAKISRGYGYYLQQPVITDPNCANVGGLTTFSFDREKVLAAAGEHNPYPSYYAPGTKQYPKTLTACAAIQQCVTDKLGTYSTLQMVFNTAQQEWDCTTYFGSTTNKNLLSVFDATADPVYALSRAATNPTVPSCNTGSYVNFYVGRKKTVDAVGKPWNDQAARSTSFALDQTDCQAVEACKNYALSYHAHTFDVHVDTEDNVWLCTLYHGYVNAANIYSVDDTAIAIAYGYSAPVDTPPTCATTGSGQFKRFYSSTGKRMSLNPATNPANSDVAKTPQDRTVIPPTTAVCDATQACIDWTKSKNYATFELVFDSSVPGWQCRAFSGSTDQTSAFSESNAAIDESFGWYGLTPLPYTGWTEVYRGFDYILKVDNPANSRPDTKPPNGRDTFLVSQYPEEADQVDKCIVAVAGYYNYNTMQISISDNKLEFICKVYVAGLPSDVTPYLEPVGYESKVRIYTKPVSDPTCFTTWTRLTNPKLTGFTLKAGNSAVAGQTVETQLYDVGDYTGDVCESINACRRYAENELNQYHTFEMFYIIGGADSGKRRCRVYKGQLASLTGETVADTNVGDNYIYSTAQNFNSP